MCAEYADSTVLSETLDGMRIYQQILSQDQITWLEIGAPSSLPNNNLCWDYVVMDIANFVPLALNSGTDEGIWG